MRWENEHWARMPMLLGLTAPEVRVLLEAEGANSSGVSECTRYVRNTRGLDLRTSHHQVLKFYQALGTAALTVEQAMEFATDPANWKELS